MMKWKPKKTDTVRICVCHEGEGKYAGTLGAFTVMDDDGKIFNVGSFAVDDNERNKLWQQRNSLVGKRATISYMDLTKDKVPTSKASNV